MSIWRMVLMLPVLMLSLSLGVKAQDAMPFKYTVSQQELGELGFSQMAGVGLEAILESAQSQASDQQGVNGGPHQMMFTRGESHDPERLMWYLSGELPQAVDWLVKMHNSDGQVVLSLTLEDVKVLAHELMDEQTGVVVINSLTITYQKLISHPAQ